MVSPAMVATESLFSSDDVYGKIINLSPVAVTAMWRFLRFGQPV
jgi:hypothetical protein